MMKLLIRFLLLGLLIADPAVLMAKAPFRVITTFTVIKDMAQNIAGDAAIVESIIKPGAEIHEYQPTPKDIVKALSADLILWNGLGLERWFDRFFEKMGDIPAVVISEGVVPIPIRQGRYQDHPNPHAWMSTENALIYVENIRRALVQYDPENAETYNHNAKIYSEKIKVLSTDMRKRFSKIPEQQRWLVTGEGAFSYLARDFDLKEAYLWPINAERQGTPQQIRKVIDLVKANHISVVFSESTASNKSTLQVVKETGAHYGGVLYVDSLSTEGGPVPTYIDLLRVTIETIANGFEQ